MEIVKSSVSVYEVKIDLKEWDTKESHQISEFIPRLLQVIPTLEKHKCMTGEEGGFE